VASLGNSRLPGTNGRPVRFFGRGQRDPTALLPQGTQQRVADFGKSSFYPDSGNPDYMLEPDMYTIASANQDGFLRAMADMASEGGWVALGAERLVVSVVGANLAHPAYAEIMEAALGFLRQNGVANNRLTGYEWEFWGRNHPGKSWQVGRPLPHRDDWSGTPLTDGEMRRVAQMTADPGSNLVVIEQRNGVFVAVIDAARNEEDPRRVRNDWYQAESLYDLFVLLGNALQIPPYWVHEELAPLIPLAPPRI